MNTQQQTQYLDSLEKLAIIQEICENYTQTDHSKAFALEMISYLNTHSIREFHEKYHALNNMWKNGFSIKT